MKIWYLKHSAFAVETARHFLIFDYYLNTPQGGTLCDGVISPEELAGRDVLVFASHGHHDHYNRCIFDWADKIPKLHYVLSDGILCTRKNAALVAGGQTLTLGNVTVRALTSTDEGVAFLVKADGETIYHAGDLNWWHWEGESARYNEAMAQAYQCQINTLRSEEIDVAFLPLDPRQGESYRLGMDYFMRTVKTRMAVPMHLWDNFELIHHFCQDERSALYAEKIHPYCKRGECWELPLKEKKEPFTQK